jgi:hypothetical protein
MNSVEITSMAAAILLLLGGACRLRTAQNRIDTLRGEIRTLERELEYVTGKLRGYTELRYASDKPGTGNYESTVKELF